MGLGAMSSQTLAMIVHETGAAMFGFVFLFLYRESGAVYFGLWAAGWALRLMAALFGYALLITGHTGWLAPYATFEFAFIIVLIAAARAGFATTVRDWRTVLRLIAILPIFVALVYAFGWYSHLEGYEVSQAVAVSLAYTYNYARFRQTGGLGGTIFRVMLLVLAVVFMTQAALFVAFDVFGSAGRYGGLVLHLAHMQFILHCILTFAAISLWGENQKNHLKTLGAELDHLRRTASQGLDLDYLTGLLNQAALARRVEDTTPFEGVVAVCDMDNFKEINDHHGHLAGDEILRNIGHLFQASIRHNDEAFRWGGDEFVILFHNHHLDIANRRMSELEARLRNFRVRGVGVLPISFSWGTADAHNRTLREALDEADHQMYALKRKRAGAEGETR